MFLSTVKLRPLNTTFVAVVAMFLVETAVQSTYNVNVEAWSKLNVAGLLKSNDIDVTLAPFVD
ncbi:hypothetical protein J5751_06535 [bacterium]|nr:hypothetical protein [bacterium]